MTERTTRVGPVTERERHAFEYAVLRVVPRVERGESINAGVLLYCRPLDYLGCRVSLDHERVLGLDPSTDLDAVERLLFAFVDTCSSGPESGPAGLDDIGRRFRWLTAPRSTVVQPGPIHTGLTSDPEAELEHLLARLVHPVPH